MILSSKNIANKYLEAFTLIIVLPTLLLNIFINGIYINTVLDNSSSMILQAMEQISIGVDNEVKRISLIASTISNDDEIMDMVTQWNRTQDTGLKFDLSEQIDLRLNYIFNNSSDVQTVMFFFKNRGAYCYKSDAIIDEAEIKNMEWYKASLENKGRVLALGTLKSFAGSVWNQYVLSVSISPGISEIRNDVEAVYLGFHTNIFDSFYSGFKLTSEGEMLIIDSDFNIMASKNEELIGQNVREMGYLKEPPEEQNSSFVETVGGNKMLVTIHSVQKTNWKILNIIDYKALTQGVEKTSQYAIIASVIIFLLFLLFSMFFFRDIIIPVKSMIREMKKLEKGDFNATISIKRQDEIHELGKSFNRMVQEIKKLIAERDAKERERSKAEIEVLQSQINPHFMSNTLNSIRLMAMIAKVDSIKNMTDAFIKLLSASFAKSGRLITIREEVENLNNYIYIMKIRYGDRFNADIDIEDEVKSCYVLRLILQPIVENAILHGISELEKRGEIQIKGRKEGADMFFEVRDNGIGMTDMQIEKLLIEDCKSLKGFSSIGVRNVDRRIKLNHGEKYGLKIESVCGEYTLVRMSLPCILENEGDEPVV